MVIKFGPAGLGGVKDAVGNLEKFHDAGLKACEIAFTYGVYIKDKDAGEIRKAAEKYGVELSIHAHYWINLNSAEEEKVEKSKKRILDCCRIGHLLGVKQIVFHPGYYGKKSQEETYYKIKNEILELQEEIKKNKWDVKLAPETTGKVNVFGSVDEILQLVKETGCGFTVDFAHLLARSNGKMEYKDMVEKFKDFKELHCHFSGIVYGEKGEKHHKVTPSADLKELIGYLKKSGKKVVIINESPEPFEDSVRGLKILEEVS